MAFTFKPAVLKNAELYELPRPVVSVRIQDGWDYERFKVPLLDGDFAVGHSRQGIDIAIEGRIGTQAGGLRTSEAAMFAEIEKLRSMLNVGSSAEKYSFFLYHDAGSGTYRRFGSCSTVRFESDLSDAHLFAYSAVIHADDPVIYTDAG